MNLRGAAVRPSADPAPASAGVGLEVAQADDPTVIVSRAPRLAFGRAFASSTRSGPRRLGAQVLQCCLIRCLAQADTSARQTRVCTTSARRCSLLVAVWSHGSARALAHCKCIVPPAWLQLPSDVLLARGTAAGLGGAAARVALRPPGLRLAPTAEADETGGSAEGSGGSMGGFVPSRTPDSALPAEAPATRACGEAGPNPAMARSGLGPAPAAGSARGDGKAEGERKRKADLPMLPRSPAAAAALAAGASGAKRRSSPVPEVRLRPQTTHGCCCLGPELSSCSDVCLKILQRSQCTTSGPMV